MTITLTLSPATEAELRQRAARAGKSVDDYVQRLVEQAISPGAPQAVLAAAAAAPPVPAAWVDELEALIAEGQRAPSRENPFAEGA
jgi:plasmid stability protein